MGAGSSTCGIFDPDAPPPPDCNNPANDPPPTPKAVPNLLIRQGQQSTNTFDTTLQRPQFVGISPLHL